MTAPPSATQATTATAGSAARRRAPRVDRRGVASSTYPPRADMAAGERGLSVEKP